MSGKGGMDGGWFFAAEMPISHALEASDPGHASRSVLQWTTKHKITDCFTVGRGIYSEKREEKRRDESDKEDMGSSPPRQSEIRVRLKGGFNDQLRTVLDAFEFFEFASIPPNVLEVIEVYLLSLSSPFLFLRLLSLTLSAFLASSPHIS